MIEIIISATYITSVFFIKFIFLFIFLPPLKQILLKFVNTKPYFKIIEKINEVVFKIPYPNRIKNDMAIILDPENRINEITKINNRVVINKDILLK